MVYHLLLALSAEIVVGTHKAFVDSALNREGKASVALDVLVNNQSFFGLELFLFVGWLRMSTIG